MSRSPLNRDALLQALDKPVPSRRSAADDPLNRVSLAETLPSLTLLDHERLYRAIHDVAKRLLGQVPEPEVDMEIE